MGKELASYCQLAESLEATASSLGEEGACLPPQIWRARAWDPLLCPSPGRSWVPPMGRDPHDSMEAACSERGSLPSIKGSQRLAPPPAPQPVAVDMLTSVRLMTRLREKSFKEGGLPALIALRTVSRCISVPIGPSHRGTHCMCERRLHTDVLPPPLDGETLSHYLSLRLGSEGWSQLHRPPALLGPQEWRAYSTPVWERAREDKRGSRPGQAGPRGEWEGKQGTAEAWPLRAGRFSRCSRVWVSWIR